MQSTVICFPFSLRVALRIFSQSNTGQGGKYRCFQRDDLDEHRKKPTISDNEGCTM